MDKSPDAFRTISEVADDLDIPQHVLRFWETRFAQIKPMKRSGGRRYYRPDDVDLLRGIRRLLYGEGYTIRGVQRILKEHGIKAVQGVADQSAAVSFGAVEEAIGKSLNEEDDSEILGGGFADEDEGYDGEEGIDYRFVEPDEASIRASYGKAKGKAEPDEPAPSPAISRAAPPPRTVARADRERLERVLSELVACRQLLDSALKEG